VLFPSRDEAAECEGAGLARRYGLQFHWRNAGYGAFDDFLGRFNSKHRNQIKRERREMLDRGIELVALSGSDLDVSLADQAYDFYRATVDKFPWGRRYLKRAFFEEVFATMPERLHFVLARERGGRALGGAFNLLGPDRLYGRYWGAQSDVPFLHFNVCFYFGIEECIRRGLDCFEPGAGGEHKLARGFEPTITHSAHHLRDPRLDMAIRDFLERERAAVEKHVDEAAGEGRLR
jgi:predicted N-acyltransferase